MIYTLSYPYDISGTGIYTISKSGTTLYAGSNDFANTFDIMPIIRQLTSAQDIRNCIENNSYSARVETYSIQFSGNTQQLQVVWDYSPAQLYTIVSNPCLNINGFKYAEQMFDYGTNPSVVRDDDNYTLYFLNLRGGISILQLEGRNDKSITAERTEIEHSGGYYRSKPMTSTMLVNKSNNYELNTGWLTDEQSNNVQELLSSTQIYLQTYDVGRLIPIVISDTEMSVKNVNRDSLYNYTFKVKEANKLFVYA